MLLLPSLAFGQGLNKNPPGIAGGPVRTNYALQSNSISTGSSITSPWGAIVLGTISTVAGAPGGGTWAQFNTANVNGYAVQTVTVPSSTKFVLSVNMKKASGTGYAGLMVTSTTVPSACACTRSDGGTCSANVVLSNACEVQLADLGTTAVRVTLAATYTAKTSMEVRLYPQQRSVAGATTQFSGAQLEVGSTKSLPLCVTTTAAKTCK